MINSFVNTYRNIEMQRFFCFSVLISTLLTIDSATIKHIPVIIFFVYVLCQSDFLNKRRIKFVFFVSCILLVSFIFHGILVTKDLFLFFISYLVICYFVGRGGFYYKFVYLLIMITLLWYLIINFSTVSYLPHNMMINVFGEGTKHGTASLGTILFLSSIYICYYRWRLCINFHFLDLFFVFAGIYFVFFSTSRSAMLALLASILMLIVNRNGLKKIWTWIIFLGFNISVFFFELLQNYTRYMMDIPILSDYIKVDNIESYGITSGRAWLWAYHIDVFLNNPFVGGGREYADFKVGDLIEWGVVANAGTESPFTGMLACNGVIGIIQIIFLVYLFAKSVSVRNVMGAVIMFSCIYNTTMGLDFVSNRGLSLLLIALYFMSFYDNRMIA